MKRILTTFLIMIFTVMTVNFASANGDYAAITSNAKIADSLRALESINAGDVLSILNGRNLTQKPIRVLFRELEMFGMGNCEAVTMKTQGGGLIIYINKKHENAPSEAIACLIAHESQHHLQTNTQAEELRAWLKETSTWNAFVRRDPNLAYSNHALVKRQNYIDRMYVKDNGGADNIKKLIVNNPQYAGLN